MTRRRRIQIVLLLLMVSIGVIYLANREPSYNGRALSSWMEELDPNSEGDNSGQAYEAIQEIGTDALPYILDELRRKDSKGKRKLMEWNDKLESRLGREVLKLKPSVFRRLAASEAIGALGSNAVPAIPEISRNLTDQELAGESASALARIGQPALPTIKELARSTNPIARWACMHAILQFTNANDIGPILVGLTGDTQSEVRGMAAHELGRLAYSPKTSVPILTKLLSDPDKFVQSAACRGLGGFSNNAAATAPALSNMLVSAGLTDTSIRIASGMALRRTGPSAIPVFLKLLSHPDGQIRADAVRHLGSFRDESTNHVAKLVSLLGDPDRRVRNSVLMSLRLIHSDPKELMPPIIEAFKLEKDETTRTHYMTAFQQFGEAATNALPMLTELASSAEGESRIPLLLTIAAIDETTAKTLGAEPWLLDSARASRQHLQKSFWHRGETNQPGTLPLPPP